MTAIESQKRITLEDYRRLPEGPPHYELEEGELIPMTSPSRRHQRLLAYLFITIDQFVLRNKLGQAVMEVDVYLPDGRAYIPDMAFVAAERMSLFAPTDDKIRGASDLVVELLSQNTARDRVQKMRGYQANGVPWYWIIEPESLVVEEFHLMPEGYLLTANIDTGEEFRPRLFEGLVLNLAELLGETPSEISE